MALLTPTNLREAAHVVIVGLALAGLSAAAQGVPRREPAAASCTGDAAEHANPVLWLTLDAARQTFDGGVAFIDVRPVESYAAGHISGAISLPLTSTPLDALLDTLGLPAGHTVVVYDDDAGSCADAMTVAEALAARGHDTRVLEPGFGAWLDAGHPAEAGLPASAAAPALSSPEGAP